MPTHLGLHTMRLVSTVLCLSSALAVRAANLTLVKEYSGQSFFTDWQFYGDTTAGLVPMTGPWNGSPPYDDINSGKT